ncbi:MAG: hypothetical protein Q9179_002498 [Wetmoreana sp. 5 TL-2023]
MEPASAIGLLASITSLAEAAFKLVSLINTIKQGGKQRLRLFTELNSLWMVLKLLETHFDPDEQEISEQWLDTIKVLDQDDGVFDQVSTVFDNLTDRLQPKTGHLEELTQNLERLKSTINLAYNSTNSAVVREIQSDTKYLKLSVANDEVKAIIDWISNLNFLKQLADFVNQAREGTGAWFLQRPEFQQWASGYEAMLWCPGIMGAGKTFIASLAVDYLKKTRKGQNVAVLVLYCGYNESKSQSVDSLVAALIKQILQTRPNVSEDIKKLHKQHSRTDVFPSLQELTKILRVELDKFDDCFIVVDGLDELLEESRRKKLLETLTHGKVNVMITSRPLDSIRELFSSFEDVSCDGCEKGNLPFVYHCKQCQGRGFDVCKDCRGQDIACVFEGHYLIEQYGVLEVEVEATPSDIRNYVEWRIDHEGKLFESVNKKRNLRDEISVTIVQQANGMFLLAKLHMDSLATTRTPRAVQLALQNLPTEIGDTYDRAMERIKGTNDYDRQIVMNFLLWIAFSTRPLSVAEVEHASSITTGASDVDQDNILSAGELTSMCAGLVIVDASEIVRLVHFSAQSYFREHRERWFANGNAILARNCLTYLSYKAFDAGATSGPSEGEAFKQRIEQYPLIDYSAAYWGFHAAKAQSLQELTSQIITFLSSKPRLDSAVQAMWQSDSPGLVNWDVKTGAHPLHLAAFFGLEEVVLKLLKAQEHVDCRDPLRTTPLMYAAMCGHLPIVQILLREGAHPNLLCSRSCAALHQAIASNHIDVSQHLLNVPDIEVNSIDTSRRDYTPLMLAVINQREDMVNMLLRNPGLEVNLETPNEFKSSALGIAAGNDNVEIVRQILAHPKCDVNKRDHWSTPLAKAARAGLVSVVEALLDHGADPEIQEYPKHGSGTPLNRAIDYGHVGVVKVLLQRGANPRVVDAYNKTIIHSAAVNGRNEVLRILFERPTGIDINQQGTNGRTALHDAAYFNYCETIKLLFENGARTDIHDGANRSALGVAKDMNNLEALELLRKLRNQESTRDNPEEHGPLRHTQGSLDSTQTGFLTSVKLGQKDVVQAYIESSKNDPNIDINLVDLDQHSALHIAVQQDHIEILEMLLAAPNIKIDSLDRLERSALHWSAMYHNPTGAEILLNAGADFTLKDHFSETPLDISIYDRWNGGTTMALLEAGAMPREKDTQNALQIAVQWGTPELVERLVNDGGGDPERKDWYGMTLVKRAEEWENWGVIATILRLCEEKERERSKRLEERELVRR